MAEKAAVPLTELQEQFATCSICLESFDEEDKCPRILPCYHTFCTTCLHRIWNNSQHGLGCPSCRKTWPVHNSIEESFERNRIVNNLVDYLSMKNKPEQLLCQVCEKHSKATHWCQYCVRYLCNECLVSHKNIPVTKQHKTIPLTELRQMTTDEYFLQQKGLCKDHENVRLDLFCKKCWSALCSSCVLVSHRDHDICNLKDIHEEKKNSMTTELNKLQASKDVSEQHSKKLKEENTTLDARKAHLLKTIDDSYDTVIAKLSERKEQMKQDVVSNIDTQKAVRDEQIKVIAESQSEKNDHVLYCQQAMQFALGEDFLQMCESLEKRIQSLTESLQLVDVPMQQTSLDDRFEQVKKLLERNVNLYDGVIFKEEDTESPETRKLLCLKPEPVSHRGIYREVSLTPMKFSEKTLNWETCCINENKELVNKRSVKKNQNEDRMKVMCGVTGDRSFTENKCYIWESEITCHILESAKLNYVAAQIGICEERHCDEDIRIANNKNAWGVSFSSCKKHNKMCFLVFSCGKGKCHSPVCDYKTNTLVHTSLTLVLDTQSKTLHIINTDTNTLVHTLTDVDVSQPLIPVFGVYSSGYFDVKVKIIPDLSKNSTLLKLISSLICP